MELDLFITEPLKTVFAQLKTLEPLIYVANNGAARAHFEQLLAPDFWEVGASGKIYGRDFVLDTLEQRQQLPIDEAWHTSDYDLQQIAEKNFLLTYTLHQPTRDTRRATLWRQTENGWQMVYHQGTVVAK